LLVTLSHGLVSGTSVKVVEVTELSSRTFGNFVREFSSFQVAPAGYGRAAPSPHTALLVLLS